MRLTHGLFRCVFSCVSSNLLKMSKGLATLAPGGGVLGLTFFFNAEWEDKGPLSGLPEAFCGKCSIAISPRVTLDDLVHGL